jgi:hypothetical protein
MELDRYQNLMNYLETDVIPDELTEQQKKQLINQARYFEVKKGLLYKKNRKDPQTLIRVIK